MYKKPIIVFEGIEASGKSHHISIVSKYFQKNKIPFIKLREPGGNKNSEKIRKLILNKNSNFHKNTDLLLYFAARNENINKIIKKNIKKKIILIDRFSDSTMAYQHYGMGIDQKIIKIINKFLLNDITINYTFLNIVNEKNLLSRLRKRKNLNRYDKFNLNFYKKVQNGYLKLAKKNKKSYQIVNSNHEIKKNEVLILDKIRKLIK
tara:strand:- start:1228 stop:1845 length:618 start_codon:yes stop_codon:yes gene_type:complete